MRNVSENHCSCCCLLELCYPKEAGVIPEHLCAVGQELRKYSCLVVAGLPDLILRTVKEYVLLEGVPVEIEEHDQSIFPLLFQFCN